MKLFKIIFFISIYSGALTAQDDQGYIEIVKAETALKSMFDRLYDPGFKGDKLELYDEIDSVFNEALRIPGSFDFRWEKLDKIGKLKSDDDQLRIFSWLYMIDRDNYKYSAVLQVNNKGETSEVVNFIPGDDPKIKSEDYPQTTDDWHGKVYYDIITTSEKRKTYYTILGYDLNDSQSSIKTIEVISLRRGNPTFIDQRILDGGTVKDRLVLEYSADVMAGLRYDKELDMIVFDHLMPLHPLYHGIYQFYGPDGSYDGLRFKEGIWVREDDVDARNL